ncbi:MAG: efflux RND transporter periplasmic adaptor subunit [Candidatus Peribacteraceae bacterium]|nr:efflux RND transporter periplasmic adaptor subunit [Candidatus Peribacteraceae bacterium]MDD5741889.1 efflux RND transporter periplasmic adaptor subunit [Candidatus Peribacteraceae bacterium]
MWSPLPLIRRLLTALKSFVWRHPIWSAVLGILGLLLGLLLWYIFSPVPPQMITETVRRGDLVQKVEAVGTITSDHDVNMKFPLTGIVGAVSVKEGDRVTAGQELAKLRNESAAADLAAAAAQYRQAQASYQELVEGTRPEDLAIAEAQVANKRAALEAAQADLQSAEEKLRTSEEKLTAIKAEATTNLAGYLVTSSSTCAQQISLAKTALNTLDDIFASSVITDMAKQYRTTSYAIFRSNWTSAQATTAAFTCSGFATYQDSIASMQRATEVIVQIANVLQEAYSLASDLPLTTAYDTSVRETTKSDIAAEKAVAQTALSAINTAIKSLQDAATSYTASIATEENTFASAKATAQSAQSDILTYETALRTQEAQLALSKAGPRDTQLAASRASMNAAAASVARAHAKLEDTIIRSPTDGVITKVDFKEGEFTGDADNIGHSITLLGTAPYRVEMFLSEVDIPKVLLSQSGSIDIDAFPNVHYALRVTSIEPGPTKVDGVSKYRVSLNFVYPHEEFKIGMTGDAEIITGEVKNALLVPVRAVIQNTDQEKIVRILENGNVVEKPVVTGMESDTDAEIVSGVSEGDTVVVLIKK